MEKKYSREIPIKVERVKRGFNLHYNIKESTEEDILQAWKEERFTEEGEPDESFRLEHKYVYNVVYIPMGQWKYDGVVNAIIREKYRADEMEAITNNMNVVVSQFFAELVSEGIIKATAHLVETMKEVSQDTFKEMQEWRALAKREAKEVFNVK